MGDLPALIGQRFLVLHMPEGSTVGDLLAQLSSDYGDAFTHRVFSRPGALHHYILIFVGGRNAKELGGLAALLGNNEVEVVMLPMFEGG
ncbi:MAG: MoaD/ThiS family protein [Acidobacteria bacterium]|nr:MoaD/ThiS family protein [Acidobacteriota bacterium]